MHLFNMQNYTTSILFWHKFVLTKVLPIRENRDGEIYMASGCDSEFEGELVFYKPVLDIIEKLLDGASEVSWRTYCVKVFSLIII